MSLSHLERSPTKRRWDCFCAVLSFNQSKGRTTRQLRNVSITSDWEWRRRIRRLDASSALPRHLRVAHYNERKWLPPQSDRKWLLPQLWLRITMRGNDSHLNWRLRNTMRGNDSHLIREMFGFHIKDDVQDFGSATASQISYRFLDLASRI